MAAPWSTNFTATPTRADPVKSWYPPRAGSSRWSDAWPNRHIDPPAVPIPHALFERVGDGVVRIERGAAASTGAGRTVPGHPQHDGRRPGEPHHRRRAVQGHPWGRRVGGERWVFGRHDDVPAAPGRREQV